MNVLEKILEEIDEEIEKERAICKDLEGTSGWRVYEKAMKIAKDIISKHMNDGWIPVECKLPKTNGIYNVARHIDGHFISDSSYFDGQNTWHSDNRVNHSRPYLTDVIAWQPLPEPYRPERNKE